MNALQNPVALLGRLLIAALFIPAGIAKIGGFAGTAGYIAPDAILMALGGIGALGKLAHIGKLKTLPNAPPKTTTTATNGGGVGCHSSRRQQLAGRMYARVYEAQEVQFSVQGRGRAAGDRVRSGGRGGRA